MPYTITEDPKACPTVTKPYAVKNKDTGELVACHPNEDAAKKQVAALMAKEMDNQIRKAAGKP